MCNSCKQLHFYDRFRSALQYSHEISKIRGLVSLGDMTVLSATAPLEQMTCEPRGYFRHEVQCAICSQRFVIWLDTSDGSGGLKAL